MQIVMGAALLALAAGGAGAEPSLDRGTYLVEGPMACGNCHTPFGEAGLDPTKALGGRVVIDDEMLGTAIAPNVTPAGRVADWSDEELVRAIREGIRPDGTVIGPPMPIGLYRQLSDDDVQSVVMYLRQVPAVENDPGQSAYNIPLPPNYGPPVETVAPVPVGATVEHGAYLAGPVAHCIECHTPMGPDGAMLFDSRLGAGGLPFEGPGGVVLSANITPTGLDKYSDAELEQIIRTGERPDGTRLAPVMPVWGYAKMTPDDVAALILYLRSLPPQENG
jgi:mono/diheme cytochrome c family protein